MSGGPVHIGKKRKNKTVEIIQKSRPFKPIQEDQWRGCRSNTAWAPLPWDRWQELGTRHGHEQQSYQDQIKIPRHQKTSRMWQLQTFTETGRWKAAARMFGSFSDEKLFTLNPVFNSKNVRHSFPRFLQISLGNESCDQISASPNRPKRAKSRDKTAESLFIRAYTLVKFSQTKRCFFSFYNKTYKNKWYINIIIVYTTQFIFC